MAALTKQRDELQTVIRTYKSLFETTEQLIKELKSKIYQDPATKVVYPIVISMSVCLSVHIFYIVR